jgi:hypothetical protein
MDKFLDAFDLPKLIQESIYKTITSNEIKTVIKCHPTKKSLRLMDLLPNHLKKNYHQYSSNFSRK